MKVDKTCGFKNAGRGKWGHGFGTGAVDLGNGLVSQEITFGPHGCTSISFLSVMDCNAGKGIALSGAEFPQKPTKGLHMVAAGAYREKVENILVPKGYLDLSKVSNLQNLKSLAAKNEIEMTEDMNALYRENPEMKRYRYSCGCKLHYPDSPGAKL